eukprot:s4379_g3.t1
MERVAYMAKLGGSDLSKAIYEKTQKEVLLLDEATSSLDAVSERQVQVALDRLLKSKPRTTIIIAHRLSTVRDANQICVFNHGRIVEKGRHEQLIAVQGGHYSKLAHGYASQKATPKTRTFYPLPEANGLLLQPVYPLDDLRNQPWYPKREEWRQPEAEPQAQQAQLAQKCHVPPATT